MKIFIKKGILFLYTVITLKIPNLLFYIFCSPKIKKEMRKMDISNVKEYNFSIWHFGYCYYTAQYNNRKVFIKYNTNKCLIQHEFDNYTYLSKNSKILKEKTPAIYGIKKLKKGAFLIEEFCIDRSLYDIKKNHEQIDLQKIFNEFIIIIKELQKYNISHNDITLKNIYLDKNGNVKIIDYGFSIINNSYDLSFIGPKNKQKFVVNNINKYSRVEPGYVDDAISFIIVSMDICNEFITKFNDEWKCLNFLSNRVFFDGSEVKYENQKD